MVFYSFNRVEVDTAKDEIEIIERRNATFCLFDLAASNSRNNIDSIYPKENLLDFETTRSIFRSQANS